MSKKTYVQVDAFYTGSTGSLMRKEHKRLTDEGWDSYIFWGRGRPSISDHEIRFADPFSVYAHALCARLFDRAGFYSKRNTRKLISKLEAIDPDVIHLHGLQGYYINLPLLFTWLGNRDCKIRITLHDCWLMTGHCPHFSYIGCDCWRTLCHDCPLQREYPASLVFDQSTRNHQEKQHLLSLLDPENVEIVCPSEWMRNLAIQSHLSSFKCIVQHNEIDRTIFKPVKSDFRARNGLDNRFLILGVAANWTQRKGLNDFLRLRKLLDPDAFQILLIGLDKKQTLELPADILGMPRTDSQRELVEAYSASDLFVNPTYEDNYPTVNLEAEACETPVVCYDTGGCSETLHLRGSSLIPCGDINSLALCIKKKLEQGS